MTKYADGFNTHQNEIVVIKLNNKIVFPSVNCQIFNFCQHLTQQWPPPEILYALKPAREECQAQTGVSDGKKAFICSHLAHQHMVRMNF